MRKLVALVVTLLVLVAADSVARVFAAERLSTGLRSSLGLEKDPEVSLGGFPFLWGLARGELATMTIAAGSLEHGSVTLDRVKLELKDVAFSPADALTGDLRSARVASGNGSARMSLTTLEHALRETGGLSAGVPLLDLSATSAMVSGTTLTVGPLNLELPVPVGGMSYTSARVGDGAIRLMFSLRRTRLRLS